MHLLICPLELSSDVLICIKVYWSVHQNTANKATNLFHVRQLCPLQRRDLAPDINTIGVYLVRVRVVTLHGAEDGLVLTKAAPHIDTPLVSHHSAAKPGLVHWLSSRPLIGSWTVALNWIT